MKVLNLYSGIGGNRRSWPDNIDVTAVEYDKEIARVYQDLFPDDIVHVTDAHKFLLDHFREYDFIWASPPCPSHSCIRKAHYNKAKQESRTTIIYPDMSLYQEIILLKEFVPKEKKWVVENVMPYYEPLIPAKKLERHFFWCNFHLDFKRFGNRENRIQDYNIDDWKELTGLNITKYGIKREKILIMYKNCVSSNVSKHIFECAVSPKQLKIF